MERLCYFLAMKTSSVFCIANAGHDLFAKWMIAEISNLFLARLESFLLYVYEFGVGVTVSIGFSCYILCIVTM